MDGDAAREEYCSALISWQREDSISLKQELSTHMRKMLLHIPPTLMWRYCTDETLHFNDVESVISSWQRLCWNLGTYNSTGAKFHFQMDLPARSTYRDGARLAPVLHSKT